MQWLIQEEPQPVIRGHTVSIFAIVGIAGMGKTELARFAYGDSRVRMNFDSFAWVSLSGNFRAKAVTRVIVESIYNKLLLVLDDAWEDNNLEEWKSLADSLKDCKPGSRILLTTQMQSVADIAEESIGAEVECLKLGELNEFNNLELLKSCLHSSGHPADLELIAEQIAKQIGGCPLVTIRVASQLNRMDPKHWYSVLKGSWRYEMGMNFLFTSYNRLPTELQNCFRYCSIFPKGHRFDKLELVNMWIDTSQLIGKK